MLSVHDNPYYVNDGQNQGLSFIDGFFYQVKIRLLGPMYIEGTWVGYAYQDNQRLFYIAETFDQTLITLSVIKTQFTRGGKVISRWESNRQKIDMKTRTLSIEYLPYFHEDSTDKKEIEFLFPIGTNKGSPPRIMNGKQSRNDSSKTDHIFLEKYSDTILSHRECYQIARERYR